MTAATGIREAVWAAHRAGLCVVPPREDGSKQPLGQSWKVYQQRQPTLAELRDWYANGRNGLGAVMGSVSGNLELFEFDNYDTYLEFKESAVALGHGPLIERIEQGYSERTPGGGIHWFYRCAIGTTSDKLAERPDGVDEGGRQKWKALIETKGEGGYAVMAPSQGGVHPTGKPYLVVAGSVATIVEIAGEERDQLWELARTFDQRSPLASLPQRQFASAPPTNDENRPGDDFARRTTWQEILEPHGWRWLFDTSGGKGFWRRPGKDRDWSATTNHSGWDLLFVFSTSTPFQPRRGYGKFHAYAVLNHNGDFAAAARELGRQGYGEPPKMGQIARIGAHRGDAAADAIENVDPNAYTLDDTGNGELFADLFRGHFRYDHRRGRWYRWVEHWWTSESDRHARFATKQIAHLRFTAAADIEAEDPRKAAIKWARVSASKAKRDALLSHAADEPEIASDGDDWDRDPFLMGVANGIIDLRTGSLREGNPDDHIASHSPVTFDPVASAPRWERFLREVFREDAELVAWLQRMIGYTMTGAITEHAFVVCFGTGANGKSTLFTILNYLLGDYAGTLNFSALAHTLHEAHPTEIAALAGRRFVTANELNEGQRLNEARIKALTGGDAIKARFMRQDEFEFRPILKLWLAVNHKPVVSDDSRGFWRRMRLLPFLQEFPINRELEHELRAEASGILTWAVQGCLQWQQQGLGTAAAIDSATAAYQEESNPLVAFLADCCTTNSQIVVRANTLYKTYEDWANEQGQRESERLTSTLFGRRVSEQFTKQRDGHGNFYKGIGLNDAWSERVTRGGRYAQ